MTEASTPPGAPAEARRGHVIVCGLKGVGLRTVEQLHLSGVPVVVIDDDPDVRLAAVIRAWGVPHVARSAHLGDGLAEAGVERAWAVVCSETDELVALEIALRVREARPDLRLVVQLANPSVGLALERVTGPGTVLDVAALAAGSFVEACLRRRVHEMEFGATRFAVVQTTVADDPGGAGTFRTHYGNLVPVAVMAADGTEMARCPGRDHPVAPGDRVALLGTPAELAAAGFDVTEGGGSDRRHVPWPLALRRRLRGLARSNARGLVLALVALAAVILVAAAIIHLTYVDAVGHPRLSFLTSLYFTVETVATVGFGDFSFARQGSWLQIFGIALIVIGVTLTTTAFALFTNFLVSRRIEQSLGQRRVPGMVGHVVVVGLGAIGIRVVEGLLAAGLRVVVIERDDANRHLGRARSLGVPVVIADATQRQTHTMVNLADSAAVAVLTSADLTNIDTGLAVRESLGARWDEVPVVLRVFDRNLARMMEQQFGFRHVRSTSALAAPWFVGAALGLDVLQTFFVAQEPFVVGRVTVAEGGGLAGLAMQELSARTRVIALHRAGSAGPLEHPPRRGTRFAGGDQAYLLGPYEDLLQVLRRQQVSAGPDVGAGPGAAPGAQATDSSAAEAAPQTVEIIRRLTT